MASKSLILALSIPLALAACDKAKDKDKLSSLDAQLTNNAVDPALQGALEDQIVVDPKLTGQSNANAVRPGDKPISGALPTDKGEIYQAKIGGKLIRAPQAKPMEADAGDPATLGALARQQEAGQGGGDCHARLGYGAGWAQKLPAAFTLYPQSKLIEAAGVQDAQCNLRVVSFETGQPMSGVIDFYYTQAVRAGYAGDHRIKDGQHVLGGTTKDGRAFLVLFADKPGGGTSVDLVANGG